MLLQSAALRVVDAALAVVAVIFCRTAVDGAAALRAPSIYMRNYLSALQYAVGISLAFNVFLALSKIWSWLKDRQSKVKNDEEAPGNSGESRYEVCCITCCGSILTKFISLGMVVAFAMMASSEGTFDVVKYWSEKTAMLAVAGNLQTVAILALIQILLYPLNFFFEWHDMFAGSKGDE